MNPLKRYFFQVFLWWAVSCVIWVSLGFRPSFMEAAGYAWLLQSGLLLVVIFYAVPQLLFKNRVALFLLLLVALVLLAAYLGMELSPHQKSPGGAPRAGRVPPFFESRLFRQLLLMSVTCLTAVVAEAFVLVQQKNKSEALAKAELKESELKFLKMQINPHFLFNALNNIYALSVTNSDKTQEGISTLSLMLRYVLYDCEQPKIPLSKELEYIAHFIELFKLKSRSEYNISFVKEIEGEEIMIAPMLLVPFIENAFKHSGIEKRGESFVRILLKAKEDRVEFVVENSVPAVPLVTDSQGGIGLQNVKKRLEILYPHKHQLEVKKAATFFVKLNVTLA